MGNSNTVTSNQPGLHKNLDDTVRKHIHSEYKKPIQQHNLLAFEQLQEKIYNQNFSSLILDSCCGTGKSTMTLAKNNPDSLIIGIDQSFKRLNKQLDDVIQPDNCLLLQANCEDIWRLCDAHNIHFAAHYILYPNPWPKSVHLGRRWHGHPVFPYLAKISDKTIVRSNWRLYLEEFQQAWCLLTEQSSEICPLKINSPLTLFEKKFAESGQVLYELIVTL